jgi:hypothetical protein
MRRATFETNKQNGKSSHVGSGLGGLVSQNKSPTTSSGTSLMIKTANLDNSIGHSPLII